MWPASLQMSREECRSILRRLELETYSQVISVFRAQGGLNEEKAKLLAELRTLFHISQDRHRAEARRVSNDEELCTIAEVISGQNTWQDWAREGRRQFPMLPRVAAQTALAFVANKLADETAKENAKLPYPADTASAQLEHDMEMQVQHAAMNKHNSCHMPNIVMEDPFKMPDIPAVSKKNLKRNIIEHQVVSGALNKRIKNESHKQQQQQLHNNLDINSNNNNTNSNNNNNHVILSNNKLTTFEQKQLEGRRFFYTQQLKNKNKVNIVNKKQQQQQQQQNQQQQLHVKSAISKKNLNKKLQKSLKLQQKLEQNRQKQIEKWEQLHQQQNQQQQQQPQIRHINNNNNAINIQEISQQQLQPLQVHMTEQTSPILQQQNLMATLSPVRQQQQQQQQQSLQQGHITLVKKDLAKHFTKLSSPTGGITNNNNNNNLIPANVLRSAQLLSPTIPIITATTTTTTTGEIQVAPTSPTPKMLEQKQLLSTPVQKYIVEDRLPPTVAQVMNFPISPQTSHKLRTINTTILPPGTKLQPAIAKKIMPVTTLNDLLTTATTTIKPTQQQQQQLFNIISSSNETGSNITLPTHAPPAIINLHGVSSNSASQLSEVLTVSSASGAQNTTTTTTTYGKVLTTKLMPVVFNNNKTSASNISTSGTTTTLIQANAGTATTVGSFIKTLPQGVLIAGTGNKSMAVSSANASNTFISTIATGTQFFRKPNILTRKGSTTPASNKPTILSNIKLTPQTPISGSVVPLRQIPVSTSTATSTTVGLRQNYRMTTSNGKVIINSVQKLNSPLATSLINPRVPLQKVQIIPASSGSIPLQHAQTGQQKNATTMVMNKQNNIVFMQNKLVGNLQNMKTNLVVLGNNTLPQTTYKIKPTNANFVDNNNSNNNKNSNNKLMPLTEDAPLDILNMPIIVENSEGLLNDNSTNAPLTFTNLIQTQQSQKSDQPTQSGGIVLGATDWEMELDQAAAAGRFTRRAYSVCAPGPQRNLNQPFVFPRHLARPANTQFDGNTGCILGTNLKNLGLSRQLSNPSTSSSHIVIDDVIVLKQADTTTTTATSETNSNNSNQNEEVVVVNESPEFAKTKEITTSSGTINVSEGGCIPMELETDTITTTTIIPASSDATFNPTTSSQPTTTNPTTLSEFLNDEISANETTINIAADVETSAGIDETVYKNLEEEVEIEMENTDNTTVIEE